MRSNHPAADGGGASQAEEAEDHESWESWNTQEENTDKYFLHGLEKGFLSKCGSKKAWTTEVCLCQNSSSRQKPHKDTWKRRRNRYNLYGNILLYDNMLLYRKYF